MSLGVLGHVYVARSGALPALGSARAGDCGVAHSASLHHFAGHDPAAFFSAVRRTPGRGWIRPPPVPSVMATTNSNPRCVTGWSTTATRGSPVPSARCRPSTAQRARPSAVEALACATRTAPYGRDCALPVLSVDLTNQAIGRMPPDLFGARFGEKHLMPDYGYVLFGQARNRVRGRFGTNGGTA